MLNIVTNVSSYDGIRIKHTIPNWVRTFKGKLSGILIIIDEKPVEGRIKKLHNNFESKFFIDEVIEKLSFQYPFIKVERLDYNELDSISSKFFKKAKPVRCQGGTPIFAFLKGIDSVEEGIILKTDCDMLFYDNGWIDMAIQQLRNNECDLIEPPKPGSGDYGFSTRCFLINKIEFMKKMPITAYKIDLMRIIDRKLKNRSVYLALEQMLQKEIDKKKIIHKMLSKNLGFSLHVISSEHFSRAEIENVIEKIEKGVIPDQQRKSWNFKWEYWT